MSKQYTLRWRASAARNQRGDIFSGYWQVHDTNGNVICDIYGETGKQDEDTGDDVFLPDVEIREIALLIAASPDLLAVAEKLDALQRQFEFYSMGNKMPGNDLYSGLLMEIVNEARAAIAAAKGEK